jgi:hypothetical protein
VARHVRHSFLVIALVALGALTLAPGAGAGVQPIGAAPLTVVKTVTGTVPAGTTFSVTIQCDGDIINDGGSGTDLATLTFDATGQPTSPDTVTFGDPGGCVVTETVNGNAVSTTYSCDFTLPDEEVPVPGSTDGFGAQQAPPEEGVCEAAGPQSGPMGVGIVSEGQTATVTIANTFGDPQPAAQIVAQPAFTG